MNLINMDGLVLVGPGSEWFWTAVSGLVLAGTFLAIYRQLSIARSANAFEQMNRIENEWASERTTRNMLEILLALREGVNPENVPLGAASYLADFWEGVAALIRAGHVDRRLVYDNLSSSCRWWWAALAPSIRRVRIETGDPRASEQFEWLAGIMADMDRKAGVGIPFDDGYLASTLDRKIQNERDRVRVAEELRAVIVRRLAPVAPPTPPTAPQAEAAPVGP